MTMPLLPQQRDPSPLEVASRCLVHWRGCDASVQPVSGQVATFSRGASATLTDSSANTFTLGNQQPLLDTRLWYDAIRRGGFAMSGTDRWSVAADWLPQAFGGWLEFQQSGSMASAGVALFSLCNDAGSGARVVLDSTGSFYRLRHHNGTTEVTVTLAVAPTTGQSVLLWFQVSSTGTVQLWQSINGASATNTVASSANTLASTWASSSKVRLSSLGTTNGAPAWWRVMKLQAGTPTLAQLTRVF